MVSLVSISVNMESIPVIETGLFWFSVRFFCLP